MPNQFLSPEGDLETFNYFVTEYWLIDQWVGDTLLTWGNGTSTGTNTTIARSAPVTTFAGGTNWKQATCGGSCIAAIKTDGTLWIWGANSTGKLGDNTTVGRSTPVTTFSGGTNWKQVAGGYNQMAAIKTDGTLWTWGSNSYGQLGDNTIITRSTPVTTFSGGTNWKQVTSGSAHIAAIKTDGSLWIWGNGNNGELGINLSLVNRRTPVTTFAGGSNWKQVAGGGSITAAIKTDGTLWTWGRNNAGQLGDNTTTNRSIPVTTFAGGSNWKQVACGDQNVAGIKTDGTLWVWGYNYYGALANNTQIDRSTPVTTFAGGTNWKQCSIGGFHTVAIKTDGTLWTWGFNLNGSNGDNTTTARFTPVTTFAGGTNWKQSGAGGTGTVAITSGTDPTFFIS